MRKVDHSALKTNQAVIIGLLLLAFLLDSWLLVAFVASVMLLGTANGSLALFKQVYLRFLKPRGWVKPSIIDDNPEPHRFAQGFGGLVTLAATLLLALGMTIAGWSLVWLVIGLAAANFFLNFCAGCFLYYQLNKLGIKGFEHAPIG